MNDDTKIEDAEVRLRGDATMLCAECKCEMHLTHETVSDTHRTHTYVWACVMGGCPKFGRTNMRHVQDGMTRDLV